MESNVAGLPHTQFCTKTSAGQVWDMSGVIRKRVRNLYDPKPNGFLTDGMLQVHVDMLCLSRRMELDIQRRFMCICLLLLGRGGGGSVPYKGRGVHIIRCPADLHHYDYRMKVHGHKYGNM